MVSGFFTILGFKRFSVGLKGSLLLSFYEINFLRGVHFFGRPKKRTKERRLDTRFLRTSGGGALTYLSRVINKSDGGAPNGVC